MQQISLKLKSYTGNVNIVNNNDLQKRILNIMLGSFLVLGFFYVFLLGSMVFNIVERKTLEADARNLSNEVLDLESVYLSMSNKVDLDFAHSLGFKETKTTYVTRKAFGSIKVAKNEI